MSTNTIEQLVKGVMLHGPDILDRCQTEEDIQKYIQRVDQERLDYPVPPQKIDSTNWRIPYKYKEMDIGKHVLDLCETDEQRARVTRELELYNKYNMTMVLKCMKYIVDTLRANNIVWGVGRGSSVASYVLHLLGVHKIDSIKYDIPIGEFFKGEK